MNKYENIIDEIRNFNRFYTVNMGFLDSSYLATEYSIVETRILFEIKIHKKCIQSDIVKSLHIDKSYLSRIIKRFDKNGFIEKSKSDEDKRTTYITLTENGNMEAERLIKLTNAQIEAKVNKLNSEECDALCGALHTIISILGKEN